MRQMGTVHPAASCGVLGVSYHLSFLLLLLYCSEEALLLLFFGWLRGVQHHGVRASPENKEHRPLSTMSNSKEKYFRGDLEWLYCVLWKGKKSLNYIVT